MKRCSRKRISLALCLCILSGLMLPGFAEGNVSPDTVLTETMLSGDLAEDTNPAEETVFPETTESTLPPDSTVPSETTVPTEETTEPEVTEDPTDSLTTEPTGETTEPTPEGEETEETGEPEEAPVYPWDEMTDEELAEFLRAEGYRAYEDDEEALLSLFSRVEDVADEALRLELLMLLNDWIASLSEPEDTPMLLAAGPVTLADINGADMFFKQSKGGECTLTAAAMLVRRAARINGNPAWSSVTANSLREVAWVESGLLWNFSYAGISVSHKSLDGPLTLAVARGILQEHPEGFVAYSLSAARNRGKPHAILITDYDEVTGILYCADPGTSECYRKPIVNSLLGNGSQDATIASITSYWYVTAPTLSVVMPLSLSRKPITVQAVPGSGSSVLLSWNDTGAAGYWVFRADSPEGPWTQKVYTATGAGSTTWTDTTTTALRTYYYRVQSYDGQSLGCYLSETVSCTADRNAVRTAEGTCGDNLRWTCYDDGELSIRGSGPMTDFGSAAQVPWSSCRTSIRTLTLADGITAVGNCAFYGCTALTSVRLPATVTAIGDWAFQNCTALTSIDMGGSTRIGYAAFRNCTALGDVIVPAGVTAIGDWAFSGCTGLKKAVLPTGLTSIGTALFYGDTALEEVTIPQGVTTIADNAFRSCTRLQSITVPSTVTSIGQYAFAMCDGLERLDLSNNPGLTLRTGAFYQCRGLISVILPRCQAEAQAFAYCSGLKTVTFRQSGELGNYAFYGCGKLFCVLVGEGTLTAPANAFSGTRATVLVSCGAYPNGAGQWKCFTTAGLTGDDSCWYVDDAGVRWTVDANGVSGGSERDVPILADGSCGGNVRWTLYEDGELWISGSGPMTDFGSAAQTPWYAHRNTIRRVKLLNGVTAVGNCAFYGCSALNGVSLADSVCAIGDWAFQNCTALTSIDMGGSTRIGYAAFRNCTALGEVTVPTGVTAIGDWAFSGCTGLKKAVLPAGLTAIGTALFYGDTALEEVTIPQGVTTIADNAFRSCEKLRSLTVPSTVTSIGQYAFALCHSLNRLDLAGNPGLTIGIGGFYNCRGLISVILPQGRVEAQAFAYCSGLKTVTFAGSGSTLGSYAFYGCGKLGCVLVSEGTLTAAENAFAATSARVLVSSTAYPEGYAAVIGGIQWVSFSRAGIDSDDVYWYEDASGSRISFGPGTL